MTITQRKYLEWVGYNDYEIQEVEAEIKNGEKPLVFESEQYNAFENGYKNGLKAKVNFTTVSDYPLKNELQLQKELEEVNERLEKQKEINKELVDQQEELKEKLAGAEKTRDRLRLLGFPTFQSCIEYTDKMNYAKAIIQTLLDYSDEYARERALNFLKGEQQKC